MTFEELYNEYRTYKEIRVSKGWLKEMAFLFENLAPIYNIDIRDITPIMIEGCFTNDYRINSPVRYNMHIVFLRALYSYAIARGYTEKNIGKLISLVPHDKTRKRLPTDSEIKALIDVCKTPFKEYLILLKNTLARTKELSLLKWDDVDLGRRRIKLRTNKTGGKGSREDFIPLNQEAYETLLFLKEWQGVGMEYVFGSWYGPMYPYNYHKLRRMCKKAGIPIITFHTIRHYSASRLSSLGVPIRVIQDLLRHLSLNTTQIYLQSREEDQRKAIEML